VRPPKNNLPPVEIPTCTGAAMVAILCVSLRVAKIEGKEKSDFGFLDVRASGPRAERR
jgi:hypothetical protein